MADTSEWFLDRVDEMEVPLQLAAARQSQREASAWFVPGSDPHAWLAELARWEIPLSAVVLRFLFEHQDERTDGRARAGRTILGVLVTIDRTTDKTTGKSVGTALPAQKPASLVMPFASIAARLFIPTNAELRPPVTDAEVAALLPIGDSELIWHPSAGLVCCESTDRLRVVDLVQPRDAISSNWDRALPGMHFRSRLLSVEPARVPTVEELLQSGGQDIGSSSESLDDLPPSPGEGLSGQIHQWTKPLRDGWKSLRKWLSKQPPPRQPKPNRDAEGRQTTGSTGGAGGSGNGLGGWLAAAAAAPLAAAGALLGKMIPKSIIDQAARLREIDRLLNLLKSDPDAGLRYALPMSGGDSSRGVATPSNQLAPRDINFGLGKLSGSSPGDPWSIPPGQQLQLVQMYRELAAREIRMGRHRRAAYIFAELLGDFLGAAMALESGLHFREAAILYRDRLSRRLDAARCLERGGLLDEAATLYIDLGMLESAADIYTRLERRDEAAQLLRRWVDQLVQQGDHLRASDVLLKKLQDFEGAIVVLDSGWERQSHASENCLKQIFSLLGQNLKHDLAIQRMTAMRTSTIPASRIPASARVLAGVANDYVDADVRDAAADVTRIIVGRQLPQSQADEAMALLAAVRSLARQDRLLGRDCDRFARLRREAATRSKGPVRKVRGISRIKGVELTRGKVQWCAAKSNNEALYVAGYSQGGLLLTRMGWSNPTAFTQQFAFWSSISPDHRVLLELHQSPAGIMIHAVGHAPLGARALMGEAGNSGSERAGSPVWATSSTAAIASSDNGTFAWRLRIAFGLLEMAGFGPKNEELTNGMLRVSVTEDALATVPMTICAAAKPIRIGVGKHLCRPLFSTEEAARIDTDPATFAEQFVELDSEIQSLHNFRDGPIDCVVALFSTGGVVVREPIQENHPQRIAEEIESPVGAFLQDGTFVVAGRNECRAYRFLANHISEVGKIPLDTPVVAVTRTNQVGQFALIHADGQVGIFSLQF
jgi:tetratricopeptide (TPR) repeat protein